MNLLLLTNEDLIAPNLARISGRRYLHVVNVLRAKPGQSIRVGLIDGLRGQARIVAVSSTSIDLAIQLTTPPPPPVPITLLLALPRPKVLRRLLQGLAATGIKRIVLFNAARVDKSYWQSPFLTPSTLHDQLLLGLEQGCDTLLPDVLLRPRFRPFIEDEVPVMTMGHQRLLAHPGSDQACPSGISEPTCLAIGPEGGFIPFEIDCLVSRGFLPVHLGIRPLRVEMAVPAILGRLLPL